MSRPRRVMRAIAGAAIVAGTAVVAAPPAGAASFDVTCDVVVSGAVNLTTTTDQTIEVAMDAPPEVNAGEVFTMTIPARTVNLPAVNTGIPIDSYTNLSSVYRVQGGTPVPGSASDPAVTISGSDVTTFLAGPVPPGALNTPAITFDVTAGAAGTTITTRAVSSSLRAHLTTIGSVADTTCPLPATTLSTTQVVEPPPPGAPNAVADVAETIENTPVDIEVLANDVPDSSLAIDVATLAIVAAPGNGTTTVGNGVVTYTPNTGFVGTDTFDYTICSEDDGPCDVATVTVDVLDGPDPAPPSTVPAPRTDELPRTGSAAGVLAGSALAAVGTGLLAVVHRPGRGRSMLRRRG
ncbi:MAG: hypothetical protein KatS3mg010_0225 [Acidimicrobiia bacterium]|nr:MAG: hypothetical protein KatS3mg010_0225 [Acidimicrobiia bacterium]